VTEAVHLARTALLDENGRLASLSAAAAMASLVTLVAFMLVMVFWNSSQFRNSEYINREREGRSYKKVLM